MLRTPRPRRAADAPAPGAARPRRLLALALLASIVAAPLAATTLGATAVGATAVGATALGAQPTTPPVVDQAAIAGAPLADPSTSREVPRLAVEIFEGVMSPFCPGLLLSNCPSPYADSLRKAIVERVERGDSRAEIEEELYATYGEAVRAAPKTSGFGLVAWLAPAVVLVGGGLWLAVWLRRASTRRARPAAAPASPALVPAGGAAADAVRADELARLDRLVRGDRTP